MIGLLINNTVFILKYIRRLLFKPKSFNKKRDSSIAGDDQNNMGKKGGGFSWIKEELYGDENLVARDVNVSFFCEQTFRFFCPLAKKIHFISFSFLNTKKS